MPYLHRDDAHGRSGAASKNASPTRSGGLSARHALSPSRSSCSTPGRSGCVAAEYSRAASPAPLTPKMAVVVSTARLLAVRVGAWRCPLRSEWIVSSRCRAVRCANVACRSWYVLRVACCALHVACCALAVARCTLIMVCCSPPSASSEPIGDDAAADMRSRHVGAIPRAHTRACTLTHAHAPTRARTRNGPLPCARALAPQTPLLL
jgi:hypothetical protein